MGRMIPSPLEVDSSLIYPAVSLSLLAAWIAATVAIIAALCGVKSRKSSPQHPPSTSSSPKTEDNTHNHVVTTTTTTTSTATEPPQPLPLQTTTTATMVETATGAQENSNEGPNSPIEREQKHRRSATNIPKNNSVVSKGKLIKSLSLSMKIPGSGAMARLKARKEEHQQQKEGGTKGEDSIWKKTIILGEKCRVPDEEDAIIYNEKGHRISAYPARTPRSLPVSRTNSFFYPDGNPSWRR